MADSTSKLRTSSLVSPGITSANRACWSKSLQRRENWCTPSLGLRARNAEVAGVLRGVVERVGIIGRVADAEVKERIQKSKVA